VREQFRAYATVLSYVRSKTKSETRHTSVRFEVFTAVTMKNGVLLQEPHGLISQKMAFFHKCRYVIGGKVSRKETSWKKDVGGWININMGAWIGLIWLSVGTIVYYNAY
jgi:ribosomal protein L35AE/L33A